MNVEVNPTTSGSSPRIALALSSMNSAAWTLIAVAVEMSVPRRVAYSLSCATPHSGSLYRTPEKTQSPRPSKIDSLPTATWSPGRSAPCERSSRNSAQRREPWNSRTSSCGLVRSSSECSSPTWSEGSSIGCQGMVTRCMRTVSPTARGRAPGRARRPPFSSLSGRSAPGPVGRSRQVPADRNAPAQRVGRFSIVCRSRFFASSSRTTTFLISMCPSPRRSVPSPLTLGAVARESQECLLRLVGCTGRTAPVDERGPIAMLRPERSPEAFKRTTRGDTARGPASCGSRLNSGVSESCRWWSRVAPSR